MPFASVGTCVGPVGGANWTPFDPGGDVPRRIELVCGDLTGAGIVAGDPVPGIVLPGGRAGGGGKGVCPLAHWCTSIIPCPCSDSVCRPGSPVRALESRKESD